MENLKGNIFRTIEEISLLLDLETAFLDQRQDHEALLLLTQKQELIDRFENEIQDVLTARQENTHSEQDMDQLLPLIDHLKQLMLRNEMALASAKQRREQILNIYVDAVKDHEKPAAFYTKSGHQRISGAKMPAISVVREI